MFFRVEEGALITNWRTTVELIASGKGCKSFFSGNIWTTEEMGGEIGEGAAKKRLHRLMVKKLNRGHAHFI